MPVHDARDVTPPQMFRPPSPSSIVPAPSAADSVPLEPKKETMRISSASVPRPADVQLKNAQSFATTPNVAPRNAPIAAAPREKNPTLLWWILLGFSALIFIIQIWTYLS